MSKIMVKVADEGVITEWDAYVEKSPQGSVFHQYNFLKVMEKHSNSKLHLLTGYIGLEPIGLFPIFEISKRLISAVFSPPPYLLIPYLGPVLLNYETLNQRKLESLNNEFIEGCLSWINKNIRPKFIYILTVPSYLDVRPFNWKCLNVNPSYTYIIDLTIGEEKLFNSFDSTRRTNIRKISKENIRVKVGGLEEFNCILKHVKERYEGQGMGYYINFAFFRDVYDALQENQIFSYAAETENECLGGVIALAYKDMIYGWQGCAKPTNSRLPFNDFVIWRVLQESIKQGKKEFDFIGANNFRICRYKSFFNPRLALHYEIKKNPKMMNFILKMISRMHPLIHQEE